MPKLTHTFAMFKSSGLLILLLCCILAGCETVTDPGDIPYVERLVVEATLDDGAPIDDIRITRTMPLDRKYDREAAIVRDVNGFVEVDGTRHNLQYDAARGVYTVPLTATRGKEYRLTAEWNGRKATARTTVPIPPIIDSISADTMAFYDPGMVFYTSLDILFTPIDRRAVYGIGIRTVMDGYPMTVLHLGYGEPIFRLRDTNDQGKILYHYGRTDSPYNYGISGGRGTTVATVYAFDEQFFDYYSSRYRSDDISFSQEEDIRWNIEGDGIGLFMGRSKVEIDVP